MDRKLLFLLVAVLTVLFSACSNDTGDDNGFIDGNGSSSSVDGDGNSSSSDNQDDLNPVGSIVYNYGALKACKDGTKGRICGSKGTWNNKPVQVRGVSFGWSNTGWEPAKFYTATAVNSMVDDWKAQVVRASLGYGEDGGYKTDPGNWTRAKTVIDAAIAKGVYIIIDWHSHDAHNETAAATEFFTRTVADYHNVPNVIFEIYNEPLKISWSTIKNYANNVVEAIRNAGANNLILVGTPTWSQEPNAAIGNEVTDSKNNTGYVFHFYAQAHTVSDFGTNITQAINAGLPVFVTEYGTTHNDGGQAPTNYNTHSPGNTDAWHTFMDAHKISSAAWNINNKYEGSAFFGISNNEATINSWGVNTAANYSNTALMTESGKYIYNKLRAYAAVATENEPGNVPKLFCDYGPVTQYGGGCFEMEHSDDCDLEWGAISYSCN